MKRFTDFAIRLLFTGLFLSICIFGINRHFLNEVGEPSMFLFLDHPTKGEVKLYWDTGQGFNEAETSLVRFGTYEKQLLKTRLPKGTRAFRFDPEYFQSDRISIISCRLGYFRWPFSYPLPSECWLSSNEMSFSPQLERGISAIELQIAPHAGDPHCVVSLPAFESSPPWEQLGAIRFWLTLALITSASVGVVISILVKKPR